MDIEEHIVPGHQTLDEDIFTPEHVLEVDRLPGDLTAEEIDSLEIDDDYDEEQLVPLTPFAGVLCGPAVLFGSYRRAETIELAHHSEPVVDNDLDLLELALESQCQMYIR